MALRTRGGMPIPLPAANVRAIERRQTGRQLNPEIPAITSGAAPLTANRGSPPLLGLNGFC